jgi:hypothetical protein
VSARSTGGRGPCPHGISVLIAAEVTPHYEYSLNPDLVLHTDVCSEWSTTEDLLVLARRLLGRPDAE